MVRLRRPISPLILGRHLLPPGITNQMFLRRVLVYGHIRAIDTGLNSYTDAPRHVSRHIKALLPIRTVDVRLSSSLCTSKSCCQSALLTVEWTPAEYVEASVRVHIKELLPIRTVHSSVDSRRVRRGICTGASSLEVARTVDSSVDSRRVRRGICTGASSLEVARESRV